MNQQIITTNHVFIAGLVTEGGVDGQEGGADGSAGGGDGCWGGGMGPTIAIYYKQRVNVKYAATRWTHNLYYKRKYAIHGHNVNLTEDLIHLRCTLLDYVLISTELDRAGQNRGAKYRRWFERSCFHYLTK